MDNNFNKQFRSSSIEVSLLFSTENIMNPARLFAVLLLTFVVGVSAEFKIEIYGIGGVILLIVIILAIVLCCCCCCKRNNEEDPGAVYVACEAAPAQQQYTQQEWQQWNQQQQQNQQPVQVHHVVNVQFCFLTNVSGIV